MGQRKSIQTFLEDLLEIPVYHQVPESYNRMVYPCARYELSKIKTDTAEDSLYITNKAWLVTVMDYDPDSEFLDKLIAVPYCSFNRQYAADGLNHFVFLLYY